MPFGNIGIMDAETSKPALLIVDDDALIADGLSYLLADEYRVVTAKGRGDALAWLAQTPTPPDLALVDLGLPPWPHRPDEGFALVKELLARLPSLPIAVLTGQNESNHARHALSLGAAEFIAKPVSPERLRTLLKRLFTTWAAFSTEGGGSLIGDSPAIQRLRLQIRHEADAPYPVLIEGESGVGKEIVAASLHRLSSRRDGPMLTVNCAALAPTLIEAALFGHARGAYTGAAQTQPGFFEAADRGTLLLDEIGELPLELQPKLLRVIESGVFQRLGETQERHTGARILAATNRDLKQEVRAGRFRADLYHRLSVLTIQVPPLRERGRDRLLLLDHFRSEAARQLDLPPFSLTAEAEAHWLAYAFPGNVRELRNIVIRLATHYPGQKIDAVTLAEEFAPFPLDDGSRSLSFSADPATLIALAREEILRQGERFDLDRTLEAFEEAFLIAAQELAAGNLSQAARLLGLQRTTLYHRLDSLRRRSEADSR